MGALHVTENAGATAVVVNYTSGDTLRRGSGPVVGPDVC